MAGISKIFVIGGQGGFEGADGVNPIQLMILLGNGNRQWLEPHYFDNSIKPIGRLRVLVPAVPDYPDSLIDSCIAFFPKLFINCPSFIQVESLLRETDFLDFSEMTQEILAAWTNLREEARPIFMNINIWFSELLPYEKD